MDVSLVLPAYNEGALIGSSVLKVHAELETLGRSYEIIVGDDGSTDQTSLVVHSLALPQVRVVRRPHHGKGGILSEAFLESAGRYVGFLDSDLEIAPMYLGTCLAALEEGFDAAIAAKTLHPEFRQRSLSRRVTTKGYNFLVRLLFRSSVSDHQAGLKLFVGDYLRSILPEIRSTGWLWDTEVLLRFLRDGKKIREIPVATRPTRGTHVGTLTTSWEMFWGLCRLYRLQR